MTEDADHTQPGSAHDVIRDHGAMHAGRQVNVLLRAAETKGNCALVRSVEVQGAEPPRHLHQSEDALCFVLSGSVRYYVEDLQFEAHGGSAVYLPRGVEHCFRVLTGTAMVLTAYLPGGFEEFELEREHLSDACAGIAALHLEYLVALAARYGCVITGPPP